VLDKLPSNQKQQLMYAFEHEFAQFVRLDGDKFIGVHSDHIKHLDTEVRVGLWSYGTIKGGK